MSELSPNTRNLARGMLETGIVKFGGHFRLRDGRTSITYINLREMISNPKLFEFAVGAYAVTLSQSGMLHGTAGRLRFLAGIPEAASSYAGAVGYRLHVPLLQRRVQPKVHGVQANLLGRFDRGDEAVLLDDVITSASAKLAEAECLQEQDVRTVGIAVLVDRQGGGRTEIESRGMGFAAAMTLSGIAHYALAESLGGVTQGMYDDIMTELDPRELAAEQLA